MNITHFLLLFLFVSPHLASGDWFAYVSENQSNNVLKINATTHTPLSFIPVGDSPSGIAITRDAKTAYVVNRASETVTPIDIATDTAGAAIAVGASPTFIAISPKYPMAYVVNTTGGPGSSGTVTPINLTNNTTEAEIPVGEGPFCLAISPDGSTVYVANQADSTISVLDTQSKSVRSTFSTASPVFFMAVTPDGATLYVTCLALNKVIAIDTVNYIEKAEISVGNSPVGIAITHDGTKAYVSNGGDNTVTPIDLTNHSPGNALSVGQAPFGIAITPDGKTVYVCNELDDTVSVIDIATNTILETFSAASAPLGVAITPDQAPSALFTGPPRSHVGASVKFDASSSFSPVGEVVQYSWDFGDGHTVELDSPIAFHTYRSKGHFSVTLSVTNSAGTSFDTQTFTGQTVSNESSEIAKTSHPVWIQHAHHPRRPFSFVGTVETKRRGHNTFSRLRTSWKDRSSSNVVQYEIFAFHKRIATISALDTLKFSKYIHPHHWKKKNDVSNYLHFLQRKYQIRSVSETGGESGFRHVKVQEPS